MLFIQLQKAIYQRLTAAGLTVYDSTEAFKKLPCAVIISPTLNPLQDKTSHFKEVKLKLMTVADEKRGKRETYELIGVIVQALKEVITLEGAVVDYQKLEKIDEAGSQGNGLITSTVSYKFKITTQEEI